MTAEPGAEADRVPLGPLRLSSLLATKRKEQGYGENQDHSWVFQSSSAYLMWVTDPNQTWSVQYSVTGNARSADITISVPGGGTEQRPVAVPYRSPTYTMKGLDHAYISAQNKGERGSVTTEIIVNSSTKKRATSEGAYTIASVSWLVGAAD